MTDRLVTRAATYYARKLAEHGATPKGVDWNTKESQDLRFQQLLRVCEGERSIELNDYGCGYGALAEYLIDAGRPLHYCRHRWRPAPPLFAAPWGPRPCWPPPASGWRDTPRARSRRNATSCSRGPSRWPAG